MTLWETLWDQKTERTVYDNLILNSLYVQSAYLRPDFIGVSTRMSFPIFPQTLRFSAAKILTVDCSPAVMHYCDLYSVNKGNSARNKPQKLQAKIFQKMLTKAGHTSISCETDSTERLGALGEICSSLQPGRVEAVMQLVWGEQRSQESGALTNRDLRKPGCLFVACR